MIDLQAHKTFSKYGIHSVGVTGLRYQSKFADEHLGIILEHSHSPQMITAFWKLGVSLSNEQRATHMSRFVDELHQFTKTSWTFSALSKLSESVRKRLEADEAEVSTNFVWFAPLKAPVSGQEALMSYDVAFSSSVSSRCAEKNFSCMSIIVPVTALCPCSKAISERGAHNQRAAVNIQIKYQSAAQTPSIQSFIDIINTSGSSPVYSLLKREDEKFVTEKAYDNPVFVEDLVRNIIEKLDEMKLNKTCTALSISVSAVDRESIHAHDCYAELTLDYQEK